MRSFVQGFLPEELLDLPQVGGQPGEGGAMRPQEVWGKGRVVAPEVRKEFRVFVELQELTYELDGMDLKHTHQGVKWDCNS
jgi:hypothetical protein